MTLQALKDRGHKVTKVRKFILNLVSISKRPLSAQEIGAQLRDVGMEVNKTTIYRELAFLLQEDIIKEIQLHDDQKRYETAHEVHHHHLVCKNCRRIDEVDSIQVEKQLSELQAILGTHKDFAQIDHDLEFFGLCRNCAYNTV